MNDEELIYCMRCQETIDLDAEGDIPDGTLEISSCIGADPSYICERCRYFGATVKYLQWGHPDKKNKFGVDIFGALKSTLRICDNMQQYIDELKSSLSRVLVPEDGGPDKAVYDTLANMENLINMARANDKAAIADTL